MKLGVGISLGTLLNPTLLTWAAELRASGIEHCCYANAPVNTLAVSAHDTQAMVVWAQKVSEQLVELKEIGMSVGVRPRPMILEQVKLGPTAMEEAAMGLIANAGGGNWNLEMSEWRVAAAKWRDQYHANLPPTLTPNFIASNTSLRAVKLLQPGLCPAGIVIQHEAADTSNTHVRAWAVRELRPHVGIIYYGRHGMVGPDGGPGYGYGADFGTYDLSHVVYVALNAAGAGDASAAGQSPGPADCTAKDLRLAAERFYQRFDDTADDQCKKHVHINVLESTPVPVMKDMIYAAVIGCRPDVIMLRSVFGKNDPRGPEGNTLTDPANPQRHWVTPNVLAAIKECAEWM